jgi:hypothetical protein
MPRPTAAEDCTDPTPGAGGDLRFEGAGTPDHLAVVEGEVCPGTPETWAFTHLPITLDQHIGARVFQLEGSISISLLTPRDERMALAPGEEFHTRSEGMYRVTVTGSGVVLSRYRLEVCRSLSPCRFVLTPTEHCAKQEAAATSVPPTYFTYVCLPATGTAGPASDGWPRAAAVFSGMAAGLFLAIFAFPRFTQHRLRSCPPTHRAGGATPT